MHHRAKDISGLRVGFLTAIRYQGSDGRNSMWTVLGVKRSTMYYRLARGVPLARLGEPPNVSRRFTT